MDQRPKPILLTWWQYYLYGWWWYPFTDWLRYMAGPPR